MVGYEFYLREETGKEHLIGILPSILNRGWKIIADHSHVKNIYFVRVEMQGA